jgi:hypothetical protein
VLSGMSETPAAALARDLTAAGRQVPGVNAGRQAAAAFTAAWRDRTGDAATEHRRMRLFRLARLVPPAPAPAGAARLAVAADRDLLGGWFAAFAREVDDDSPGHDHHADVDHRLGYGGITVWEDGGVPVTAAVSTAALDAGAREVVLYTDLANPTSNKLYERLGYAPVEDRVVLSFTPAATLHP